MIKEILEHFAIKHDYHLVEANENISFLLLSNGDKKRFLVLYENSKMMEPQELNELVIKLAPASFKLDPAFERNTDLIFLYPFKHRADFKTIESKVFAIEENPYYFKKYFLYFSEEELNLLKGYSVEELIDLVKSTSNFSEYRDNPLVPSVYSIVARIFIKTPFFKIPYKSEQLKPLNIYLEEALKEASVFQLHNAIESKKNKNLSSEDLLRELVDEELENIQD